MKKLYPLIITAVILLAVCNANAQNGFAGLLKTSPGDATKLVNAYGEPLFKGLGADLNSGWTNTAKPKKLLQFELRADVALAFAPATDKTFDVTKIGLSGNLTPDDPNKTISPTFNGSKGDGPVMDINNNGHTISKFTLPGGALGFTPAPVLQLTAGLIDGTDVTIRGIPTVTADNNLGKVSMIGFGLKHDITQYIFGPAKKLVPFDLSVLLGYSRLNLDYKFSIQPEDGTIHNPGDPNKNTDFSNQHTDAHFSSFVAEAIISKKLLFFTPFLAVGYNTSSTNLTAVGNYPVTTASVDSPFPGPNVAGYYNVFTNPVTIKETSISGFRADIGFQLNLGIRIFASASLAQYKSVNAGIGFGF